jgi:hypothetical protein
MPSPPIKKNRQRSRNKKTNELSNSTDKKYNLEFKGSRSQYKEIKFYFDNLSLNLVISGLRFSYNRNKATLGGYLNPGRKSIVKKETHLMTRKQAKIRIKNWKVMIKRYREKGYSYPTISRIKKQIIMIVSNNKKLKN